MGRISVSGSDFDLLEKRVERLEELLNLQMDDSEFEKAFQESLCQRYGHKMRNVKYDLQGGKWGVERCERCSHEESWSV
jgi:hypothetical protein